MPDSQYVLGLGAAGAKLRPSLIISVYRDWEKLHCTLQALAHQTCTEFEVVVSEDGQDAAMAQALGRIGDSRALPWLVFGANRPGGATAAAANAVAANPTMAGVFGIARTTRT